MSACLGRDAQIFGRTLFSVFMLECFGMRLIFKLVDFD